MTQQRLLRGKFGALHLSFMMLWLFSATCVYSQQGTSSDDSGKSEFKGLRVFGKVTDAVTGDSIPNLRLIAGSPYNDLHTTWQGHMISEYRDSEYLWTTRRPWRRTRIRIEAEGYVPVVTPLLTSGAHEFNFAMQPDPGIQGTVVTSTGEPIDDVQVAMTTQTLETNVGDGALRYSTDQRLGAVLHKTQAGGRFKVPSECDPFLLVFAHTEHGFAVIDQEEYEQRTLDGGELQVELEAWSRVTGTWSRDGVPLRQARVSIGAGWQPKPEWPVLSHRSECVTDGKGAFVFEHVAAGTHYLQAWHDNADGTSSSEAPTRRVATLPGEDLTLLVGTTLRTLRGKFVASETSEGPLEKLNWSQVAVSVEIPAPPFGGGRNMAAFTSWRAFLDSAEGQAAQKVKFEIEEDGTFVASDVPCVDVNLKISALKASAFEGYTFRLGRRTYVPLADSSDTKPLDLGDVTVFIRGQ